MQSTIHLGKVEFDKAMMISVSQWRKCNKLYLEQNQIVIEKIKYKKLEFKFCRDLKFDKMNQILKFISKLCEEKEWNFDQHVFEF